MQGCMPACKTESSALADNRLRARRFRERAEELRVIANDWISDDAQTALFKIALDYERMATSLERTSAAIRSVATSDF